MLKCWRNENVISSSSCHFYLLLSSSVRPPLSLCRYVCLPILYFIHLTSTFTVQVCLSAHPLLHPSDLHFHCAGMSDCLSFSYSIWPLPSLCMCVCLPILQLFHLTILTVCLSVCPCVHPLNLHSYCLPLCSSINPPFLLSASVFIH